MHGEKGEERGATCRYNTHNARVQRGVWERGYKNAERDKPHRLKLMPKGNQRGERVRSHVQRDAKFEFLPSLEMKLEFTK